MSYPLTILEEELKNRVFQDFFSHFDSKILGRIDFCVCKNLDKSGGRQSTLFEIQAPVQSFLWAEAKAGNKHDIYESFVQLVLTIGKERTQEHYLPPIFIGAFDAEKIAFISYSVLAPFFTQNDFNWKVTPSNHSSPEFQKIYTLSKETLKRSTTIFRFGEDDEVLKEFISKNFKLGAEGESRLIVTKNNFTSIYFRWAKLVKPTLKISTSWEQLAKIGIIDADFYLADLLSEKDISLKDSLYVFLKQDHYEFARGVDDLGLRTIKMIYFSDEQKAHKQFWNAYKRPPKKEFHDYIIKRRDLLVPQDIRERKGSFFTPAQWVELSQEYLEKDFGEDWQDEYYIWDCCAGTGNLLAGLSNKYRIWASTIDSAT